MKPMTARLRRLFLSTVAFAAMTACLALVLTTSRAEATTPAGVAGLSHVEALRQGERMYRQGILPSGEPIQALVQGDIEVEGTMFSCENCHLRSGLGSVEGKVITLPTNAKELFKPFTSAAEEVLPPWEKVPRAIQWKIRRPAYNDETLAIALSAGVDPAGREFNLAMPRYQLEDRDMQILIYYLRHLSVAPDPGVTDSTIRFATVIAGQVPAADREAMLAVLTAHIQARNSQTRREEERAQKAPFYRKKKTSAYRQLELSVWELQGAPETWRQQLDAYYRKAPVFALLGGIASSEWTPVHNFCEENRIPCLFPITDYPVVSDSDWYTLYFSKGFYQEGEAAARFLRSTDVAPDGTPVVQVYRDRQDSRLIASAFRATRQKLGQRLPAEMLLSPETEVGEGLWQSLAEKYPGAVVLLWLEPKDLAGVETLATTDRRPAKLFFATGLLGENLGSIPEPVREFTCLTYPYRLPAEMLKYQNVIKNWLKVKKLPVTNLKSQAGAYFTGWLLTSALMMMESDYYRDFFLDGIDMMNDETYAIAYYPRLSFGPGQRYASKGCYIVRLGKGRNPALEPLSDWVVH